MAFRDENGWQCDQKALESHRYMLDNEIGTDVCFQVGTTDDNIVRIRAHKLMLISRSEVFDAMFSSGMIETLGGPEATIRIEDIEPDIFKEMLRFIYYDNADVNQTSALDLMYVGKKYMLPKLVQLCSECLQKDLATENVCQILNQSLFFDESDLTKKCIELIERESSEVLKLENLQNASRQTMEAILKLDSLEDDETVIYEACIDWAKAQLKNHQSIDHPSDQQIREMLGDLIYDVRFATMDTETFVNLVESSTILSYEEQSTILCYIRGQNSHKRETMKFNCKDRFWQWNNFGKEQHIDRGGHIGNEEKLWRSGHDAIDVKSNRTILVTGLGLLSDKDPNGLGYMVNLEILKSTTSIFNMSAFVPATGNSTPHKVLFTAPVIMEPGILYTIIANSNMSRTLFYRVSYQPICYASNTTFKFSKASCNDCNGTNNTRGQIPQIFFRTPK